jgi:hypothetical protein
MLNTINSDEKMRLYKTTLSFLHAAAEKSGRSDIALKVNVCQELFLQLNPG